MADEVGLEVGLDEGTGLLHKGRVNSLDAGEGGERQGGVAAGASLVRHGGRGGREGKDGGDARELHLGMRTRWETNERMW